MSLHKIHTRIVIDSLTGKVEEDEFYWHDTDKDGPISQLNGGGGGGDGDADVEGYGDDMGSDETGYGDEGIGIGGYSDAVSAGLDAVAGLAGGGPADASSVADFTGPGAPAVTGPDVIDASAPAPAPSAGHPDFGTSGVAASGAAGSGMESAVGGAASMGLAGTSGGGVTSSGGDLGVYGVDPFPGLIDPTWGWGIDDTATYGYDYGLDAAGERITDDIDGGSDGPGGGTPAPGAPGPGAPGAPGVVGGPLPGSIIPPWWSGSPHAEYEWGRYGTPYAIPSPRWEGGAVPGHLTGYMPHYEGLLENAYTYPDIKALGLIYGAPPPAPPAAEEDDDDDDDTGEHSGGEGGDPVE